MLLRGFSPGPLKDSMWHQFCPVFIGSLWYFVFSLRFWWCLSELFMMWQVCYAFEVSWSVFFGCILVQDKDRRDLALRLWTLKLKTNLCNFTYLVAPLMLLISSPSGSATSDWNILFSATTWKPSAYFYTGFTTLGCTQKTSAVYSGVWNQDNGNRFLGPVPSRTSVYWATSSGASCHQMLGWFGS